MNNYVEMELASDLVRRLFLSFVKRSKPTPLALKVSTVGQYGASVGVSSSAAGVCSGGGGLFSQSSNTITGAIHSLGSRFNFSSGSKPAPSQSVPEGTKLLCTVRELLFGIFYVLNFI